MIFHTAAFPSRLIFLAIFLMAGSAILYELLLAAVLSYLLGATVLYFSLTIGIFLFALGIGSWFSKQLEEHLLQKFLFFEILLGVAGGLALPFIFLVYSFFFSYLAGLSSVGSAFYFFYWANVAEILFKIASFAVIFAIGVLVGLELPIFARLTSQYLFLKEALARIFFWDYAGALAGSIFFSIILLPSLGFLRTGFLVGLINISAALLLALSFNQQFGFWEILSRPAKVFLFIGGAILLLGFVFSPNLERFFTRRIFADSRILFSGISPYQQIVLLENKNKLVSLFLNNEWQFESGLSEKRYHETFAHPVMSFINLTRPNPVRVLILGGGDGLLLREILKYPAVESVVMVDIDPMMTRLAQTHPALTAINENSMADSRLTIINDDAFLWLLLRPKGEPQFGVIFIDFPDPLDEVMTRLYSEEFYLLVKRNLAPDGFAVIQAGSLPSQPHEVIKKTLEQAGFAAITLHPAGKNPDSGAEDIFESSFLAVSLSQPQTLDLYAAIVSSKLELPPDLLTLNDANFHRLLEPPSQVREPYHVTSNSLFRPARFQYTRGLLSRFLQAQFASGNRFLSVAARP